MDGVNYQDLFRGIQQLVPGRRGTVSHNKHIQEFTIVEATRVAIESVSWSDVDFSDYIFDGNAGNRFVQLFRIYDAIANAAGLYYNTFSRGLYGNVEISGIGSSVAVSGIVALSDAWCLYSRPNNLPTLWRPTEGTVSLFDEWDNPFDFVADSVEGFFQRVEYIYSSGTVSLQAKVPHVGTVSHLPLSAAFGDYAYEEGGASYRGCKAEFIVSQNKLSYSNIARATARKEEWAMSPPFHTRGNNVLGRQVARLFLASNTAALVANVDSVRFAVDSFMAVFGDVESYVLDIKKAIWDVGLGSLVLLDLGILGERTGVVVGRESNLKSGYSSYQIRTFNL